MLESEIGQLRGDRESLRRELSEKETENLCWREWKESEATKTLKERENKFLQEKASSRIFLQLKFELNSHRFDENAYFITNL